MPFAKGTPKPKGSGRKKGQICRLASDVRARLQELGCDPIEGQALIAMDESVPVAVRQRCFAELSQYIYPKRRSVEISGLDGAAIEVNANSSALQALEDRINGIATRVGTSPDVGNSQRA